MLRMGVIEPSQSAWRSRIVLVPKPDGTVCFCIDYREVNKLASFDAYPMPQADILISQLSKAQFLSALDLTKGYWQVPVRDEDREKTAFVTPNGLFQFRRMPFGLHGAAATFQRLVDQALEGCEEFARTYIDNIIISSAMWEKHIRHLEHVLRALERAGLKANPKKSWLGFRELKYLGYLVGRGGLKPLPDKVWTLEHHPRPSTKKQLRQFLGFVGYYSRFIPKYASTAGPLTDLLAKSSPDPLPWTPETEHAFQQL